MSTTDKTLKEVKELYDNNLEEFGTKTQAIGWKSTEQLEMRYRRILSVVDESDREYGSSFNDYGCGYGAMLDYMAKEKFKINEYNGYDISQNMLDQLIARKSTFQVNAFCESQIKTLADYSVVCGTFNVRFESSDQAWNDFIKKTLHNLNDFSRKGFSFNLLTSYVDWKEKHLYYADPLEFFDYCKRNFSKRVTLYHEDPLYEWVIVVKK